MAEPSPVCCLDLYKIGPSPHGSDSVFFVCPRCGEYSFTGSLLATLPSTLSNTADAEAKISHAIQSSQRGNKGVELNTHTHCCPVKNQ